MGRSEVDVSIRVVRHRRLAGAQRPRDMWRSSWAAVGRGRATGAAHLLGPLGPGRAICAKYRRTSAGARALVCRPCPQKGRFP